MEEIEAKFLNIDKVSFEEKLVSLGAKKIADYNYRRRNYDFPDGRLNDIDAWVRLRDEGDKITFTYKQRTGVTDDALRDGSMKEIETTIGDFDIGDQLLQAIGLRERIYKENKRTRYTLDGVEIDIDTWPLIPPYVEIEGKSWEAVQSVAEKVGFDWKDHVRGTNKLIYQQYDIDETSYSILTFDRQVKK